MKTKFDCSKTLDYAHEMHRMCRSLFAFKECEGCPLCGYNCSEQDSITAKHVEIVHKWSDTHEITNFDLLTDAFINLGFDAYLAFDINKETGEISISSTKPYRWWNKPADKVPSNESYIEKSDL